MISAARQAQGHVRNLIFRIKPRARRHQRGEFLFEFGGAVAAQGRDHESLRKGERAIEPGGEFEKHWRFHRIDLIEDKNLFGGDVRQPGKNSLDLGIDASTDIDKQGGGIGIAGTAPGGRHHGPVEPAFRREYARRIDENDLCLAFHGNPAHGTPRRLSLARNDRDLRSNEPIDERRFARVRGADKGNKAAACTAAAPAVHEAPLSWPMLSRAMKAAAAACSARRFARPFASAFR